MFFNNKSIKKILIKVLIAFIVVALSEAMVIVLLSYYPLITLKGQAIIAAAFIVFLIRSAYKIWFLFNLDHPLSENGEQIVGRKVFRVKTQ